ncbi:MAG: VanZ family protein [Bacteroidota bacterium]|nr:VanZ family protein [Bacteroidota bacterium]
MTTEKKIIAFLQFQLPLIAWCVFVYTASSIPSPKVPALGAYTDKVIHFGVYGMLCWLAHIAFHHQPNTSIKKYSLLVAVLFTVVFGMSDEFHQMFTPGRSSDVLDIAADTFGGLVYSAVYLRFRFYQYG